MPIRNGKTVPYQTKEQVSQALHYLTKNHHKNYALIFKIGVCTGLRISDILSLRYNLNIKPNLIVINESKGTKQRIAAKRLKVLSETKDLLIKISDTKEQLTLLMMTRPKDIYKLVPEHLKEKIDADLLAAEKKAVPKKRECEIPESLYKEIKKHEKENKKIDSQYIFAASTFPYSKNTGRPITRVAVWKIFKQIGTACGFTFNTACHQLRKTFAVFLYENTGNNSALVVKEVGWSDDSLLQTYLSIEDERQKEAVRDMHSGYL